MIRKLLQTDRRKKRNCITQRQIWVHSKLLFVWKCGTRDMQCSWSRRGSCSGCTQPLLSSSSKEGESSSIFLESWKHPANYDSVKWCLGASFCVFFFFFPLIYISSLPKIPPSFWQWLLLIMNTRKYFENRTAQAKLGQNTNLESFIFIRMLIVLWHPNGIGMSGYPGGATGVIQ